MKWSTAKSERLFQTKRKRKEVRFPLLPNSLGQDPVGSLGPCCFRFPGAGGRLQAASVNRSVVAVAKADGFVAPAIVHCLLTKTQGQAICLVLADGSAAAAWRVPLRRLHRIVFALLEK